MTDQESLIALVQERAVALFRKVRELGRELTDDEVREIAKKVIDDLIIEAAERAINDDGVSEDDYANLGERLQGLYDLVMQVFQKEFYKDQAYKS